MKNSFKLLSSILFSAFLAVSFGFSAFAVNDSEIRYSNELTSSPLRIFFAVLAVILFVVSEIVFEKVREKRVGKRNGEYGSRSDKK